MMVFKRRKGESFRIGDSVVVTVLQVSPSVVKLGVEAPREIAVVRSEVEALADEEDR
jgi:carbon storage regulator